MPDKKEDRPAWDKGPWYDSDNPTRVATGFAWRSGIGITLIVVFVLLLSGGVWWLKVATSGVKGKGDVTITNNSGVNRINSQAYFEDLNGDIVSYTVRLGGALRDLKAHPGDQFYETNYTGLWNTCVSAVADYNAASAKTTFKDWKTADLPPSIDVNTACPSNE